jgi:dienelactone hydrolase
VILPDSFGSRGLGPQCQVRTRSVRPRVERVRDANAARRWLQAQPWIKPDQVSLLGWSNGGSSTLWTVRPQNRPRDRHDFRTAVAFYPGCAQPAKVAWSSRLPTLVLIGEADDWTPAAACTEMMQEALGRSAQIEIITYPGAYHAFDRDGLPVRERTGLAYTADGGGRAHIGTHPQAREDAIRRTLEWIAR